MEEKPTSRAKLTFRTTRRPLPDSAAAAAAAKVALKMAGKDESTVGSPTPIKAKMISPGLAQPIKAKMISPSPAAAPEPEPVQPLKARLITPGNKPAAPEPEPEPVQPLKARLITPGSRPVTEADQSVKAEMESPPPDAAVSPSSAPPNVKLTPPSEGGGAASTEDASLLHPAPPPVPAPIGPSPSLIKGRMVLPSKDAEETDIQAADAVEIMKSYRKVCDIVSVGWKLPQIAEPMFEFIRGLGIKVFSLFIINPDGGGFLPLISRGYNDPPHIGLVDSWARSIDDEQHINWNVLLDIVSNPAGGDLVSKEGLKHFGIIPIHDGEFIWGFIFVGSVNVDGIHDEAALFLEICGGRVGLELGKLEDGD